jgi:hypothetical protein
MAAMQVVGQIGGQSLAVAVDGSVAYLGVGPRLVTLQISDPAAPALLGESEVLPGVVRDVAVAGGVAFVAAGDAGVRTLDVSDPANPYETGTVPTLADAQLVSVQDATAFVGESRCETGDCTGGLRIADISISADGDTIGFLEMPDRVNSVFPLGAYAYVGHRQGLSVVDVSDPRQPIDIGSFPIEGSIEDIAIAGGLAFVVSGPYVLVFDISSPAAPRQVGSSSMLFSPSVVAPIGDHIVVSDGFCEFGQCGSHLRVLELSDVAQPTVMGALALDDFVVDLAIAGDFAYVATWERGLTIVDLADLANPRAAGRFTSPGSVENVTVKEELAYVTGGGENGLLVIDMADPGAPRPAGALPMLFAGGVAVANGYAYVPVWVEGLRVVDVQDPANLVEVGVLDSSVVQGTVDRVALVDTPPGGQEVALAYLTLQEGGLMALDMTDPTQPTPAGAFAPPAGSIWGVFLAEGYAYATGTYYEGDQRRGILHVVDVADPTRPDPVASIELPEHSWSNVTVAGGHAYVTLADCYYLTCEGSLEVIDISEPAEPRLVSSLDVPGGAFAVTVTGDAGSRRHAYLAAGYEGVWVADLWEPSEPRLVGLADTPGRARSTAVVDNLVYVGDGVGGLLVLEAIEAP